MTNSSEPTPLPTIECPECGAPTVRTRASTFDEVGPRREEYEFQCANGHRTVVEILEHDCDEKDHDPAA